MSVNASSATQANGHVVPAAAPKAPPYARLPARVRRYITTFLDMGDFLSTQKVCRAWHSVSYPEWTKARGVLIVKRDPRTVQGMRQDAHGMRELDLGGKVVNKFWGFAELDQFFDARMQEGESQFPHVQRLAVWLGFTRLTEGSQYPRDKIETLIQRIGFHCPNLTHLNVYSAPNWSCELLIQQFKKLRSLELDAVDKPETLPLSSLQQLAVTTHYCDSSLATQRALTNLGFGEYGTDDNLRAFANHPGLQEITICGNSQITAAGLAHLTTIPQLRKFTFGNCAIRDLSCVAGMRALRSLELTHCYRNIDPLMKTLGTLLTLEELELRSCAGLNDSHMAQVAKQPNLRRLTLAVPSSDFFKPDAENYITGRGIQAIAQRKKLEYFTVKARGSVLWQFTSQDLVDLAKGTPLRELDLKKCYLTTVDADEIEKVVSNIRVIKREKVAQKEEGKAKS